MTSISSTNPEPKFDDLIHPRQRLMICAALDEVGYLRFDVLAKYLDMSAPTLSKHVAKLVEARYVFSQPDPRDQRRQRLELSGTGRAAFRRHVAALRELTGG